MSNLLATVTKTAAAARELKGRTANQTRDEAIRAAINHGHTVPEVAAAASISPIRVRQIAPMKDFGGAAFAAKLAARAEKKVAPKAAPKAKAPRSLADEPRFANTPIVQDAIREAEAMSRARAEKKAAAEAPAKAPQRRKWKITDAATGEVRLSNSDKVAEQARKDGHTVVSGRVRGA